ncbi:MAG: tRNA (N6-isopentenyl adenosine(37)-C2)-methylthiotransferase MiaB [Chloroflexi bacterium]|nr:tRNA (N6-isopentenyl adenosine(37)-C2)-methylthiotransferase MiaB [Chloroflexota bacterium]|tara:strand:+ start:70 stop:1383 length:1314 start_codon:yes stop_codon:yes gene_type:complete
MKNFHVSTVGCQMNVSDSERLASGLKELGLEENNDVYSDLVILNTCVVRQTAEDTATGLLGKLKNIKKNNPSMMICVMGCMVGPKTIDLEKRFPQVDIWAAPQKFERILEPVSEKLNNKLDGCMPDLIPLQPKIASFVPIIHGCNKFCSFCIIPYRRGREISKTILEIKDEVSKLIRRGVKEVTLLGQNVDSYGHDLNPKTDLADLLSEINSLEGLNRLRFLTSHPNDMSSKIIRAIRDLPKVCETINLPFQAGNNDVLENMRRGYTREEYLEKVQEIRETIPNVSVTTDLIIGFPGETKDQFKESVDIVERVRFDKVHASIYSDRPGTIASRKMGDDVGREEKKKRMAEIVELQKKISMELNSEYQGATQVVLVENNSDGVYSGRSRLDKLVYLDGEDIEIGDFVEVKITETRTWSLTGEVQKKINNEIEGQLIEH